jgi:putative transposase
MPRQLRIQYPGSMYNVMSRGNRRQDIFLDDVDRQDFLKTLRANAHALARFGSYSGPMEEGSQKTI